VTGGRSADERAETVLRGLRRTRQIRQFTDEPVDEDALQSILEVARWTGSSMNSQPWTFIVVRDAETRRRIGELARYARYVANAPLAIAIAMPGKDPEAEAYDEGRVAERVLVAARALGLGSGIGWADGPEEQAAVGAILGVIPPAFVRTILAVGHPTESALQKRSGPGTGRRPLIEFVRER
jgi:nitroreductase